MTHELQGDESPTIILRVPGPWRKRTELAARLPGDCEVEEGALRMETGERFEFQLIPADREFPRIFRIACRRPLKLEERRELSHYATNAAILGPAGAIGAAQAVLTVGAALVRAGGLGVFIDNSLLAHSGPDWLELAENQQDPAALFYAFINVAKRGSEVYSYGMHVLGQRDGIANQIGDLTALEDFLRQASGGSLDLDEGETFSDERGRQFYLRGEADQGLFPNHPVNNPYGRWRLEPI